MRLSWIRCMITSKFDFKTLNEFEAAMDLIVYFVKDCETIMDMTIIT